MVFFAALALRLVYLGLVYDGPDSLRMEDSGLYERRAGWFLIAGDIVTKTPEGEFVPFTGRMPGYILAVTGPIAGVKYRLPIEPTLTVFLTTALLWAVDAWRRRRLPRAPETCPATTPPRSRN